MQQASCEIVAESSFRRPMSQYVAALQVQRRGLCSDCGLLRHLLLLQCCGAFRCACLEAETRTQPDVLTPFSIKSSRTFQRASAGCCSHLQTNRRPMWRCSTSKQWQQRCRCDRTVKPRLHVAEEVPLILFEHHRSQPRPPCVCVRVFK